MRQSISDLFVIHAVATNRDGERGRTLEGHLQEVGPVYITWQLTSCLLFGDSNWPVLLYAINKFTVMISGLVVPYNCKHTAFLMCIYIR